MPCILFCSIAAIITSIIFSDESPKFISSGALNLMDSGVAFFLNFTPFLSKAVLKPSITIGITIGLFCFINKAEPFLPGAKGCVVPCGKLITQPSCNALKIFLVSDGSNP